MAAAPAPLFVPARRSVPTTAEGGVYAPATVVGEDEQEGPEYAAASMHDASVLLVNGQTKARIEGDSEPVTAMAMVVDADNKRAEIHIASRSLTCRTYDIAPAVFGSAAEPPRLLRAYKPHALPVTAMQLDNTGRFLATAGVDRTACVYDTRATSGPTAVRTHRFADHAGVVTAVAFVAAAGDAVPSALVTGADNGEVRAFDLRTKTPTLRFQPHSAAVTCIAGNGVCVFTASRDQAVHCFSVDALLAPPPKKAKAARKVSPMHTLECFERIEAIAPAPAWVSERATCVIVAGERAVARVLDAAAPTRKAECLWSVNALNGAADAEAAAEAGGVVRVIADARGIALVRGDGVLVSFQHAGGHGATDAVAGAMDPPPRVLRNERVGYLGEVTAIKLLMPTTAQRHADNARASVLRDGLIAVSTSGRELSVLVPGESMSRAAVLSGHTAAVLALDAVPVAPQAPLCRACFSQWGGMPVRGAALQLLASVSKDRTLCAWFVAHGISHEGHGADEDDHHVRHACVVATEAHVDAASAVAVFTRASPLDAGGAETSAPPDDASGVLGARRFVYALTAGADKSLKLWDLEASLVGYAKRASVPSDGKRSPKPASAIALVTRVAHTKDVNSVCVSPNGKLAATASQDKTAKLWQLPTLQPVATLRGHRRGVWSASFSPVDALLATCSGDCTAKVWSATSGKLLFTLEGHDASVLSCRFLPSAMAAVRLAAAFEESPAPSTRLGKRKVDTVASDEDGSATATAATAAAARMPASALVTTDADGVVRMWNAAQGSAVCNFTDAESGAGDAAAHGDKAWALDSAYDADAGVFVVATGSADASVISWRDGGAEAATEARANSEAAEKAAHTVKRLLADGRASEDIRAVEAAQRASVLALQLGHPMHVLAALRLALEHAQTPAAARADAAQPELAVFVRAVCAVASGGASDAALEKKADALLLRLVTYCRDWNANAHHCHVSQHVLHAVLRSPAALRLLLGGDASIASQARDVLRGIHAHTARHVDRAERLVRSTYAVDHILHVAAAHGGAAGAPSAVLVDRRA